MNILYIGSAGALSLIPFKKLFSSQYSVSAVGVYKPIVVKQKIIALENESLALVANQCEIPIIDLSAPIIEVLKQCENFSIDLVLMSCYSKRLPDELIRFATHGCFNLHPSLLPGYRGPEPIFWQLRQACDVGVSWHNVVEKFDAGDIVLQQKVNLDDGASYAEINSQIAQVGADLMMRLLSDLSAGELKHTKQDTGLASYFPYPREKDFVVDVTWTAQRAYDFMCATHKFGYLYRCEINNDQLLLEQALDYDNNAQIDCIEVEADKLYIPFKEGVLCATYAGKLSF